MKITFYLSIIILISILYCYYKTNNVTEHFYYKSDATQKSRTEIQNEIQTSIDIQTNNLNKILNETVNKVSTTMVNETASSINQKTSASNTAEIGDVVVTDDASVDINQSVEVKAQNSAIISIMSDMSSLNKMATQMAADISNKTSNDAAAKASLATLAAAKEANKQGGGPEGMLDSVMKTISSLGDSLTGGSKTRNEQETMITNKMKQDMKMVTNNTNDITNIIKNQTDSMVKSLSSNSCNFDTSGANSLKIKSITAAGKGKLNVGQKVSLTAFNDCVVKSANTTGMVNDITGFQVTKTVSDTTSKAAADAASTATATSEKKNEQSSAVMSSVDNLVTTAGGVAGSAISGTFGIMIVGVLVVGALMFVFKDTISGAVGGVMAANDMPMAPVPSSDGYQQLGGNNCYSLENNLYGSIFKVLLIILILNLIMSRSK
jgi:hypothetical protein